MNTKLYSGDHRIEVKTEAEILLLSALKAVLFKHGEMSKGTEMMRRFEMERFSYSSAWDHWNGDVSIFTDGNNGRDIVALTQPKPQIRISDQQRAIGMLAICWNCKKELSDYCLKLMTGDCDHCHEVVKLEVVVQQEKVKKE